MTAPTINADDEVPRGHDSRPRRAVKAATPPGRSGRGQVRPAGVGGRGDDEPFEASAPAADRPRVGGEVRKPLDEIPPPAVEAARYLIASLQHQSERRMSDRIGFTSALAGEGVTFISHAVAAVLAHDYREQVCVVDLNWSGAAHAAGSGTGTSRRRRRRTSDEPSLPSPGMADLLRREVSFREIIRETHDPHLTVVTAGQASAPEGEVFARSQRLSQVIDLLARHNDRVILDLPPVLASSAAIPLAQQAGAVGLVVRAGVTTQAQVQLALERLGQRSIGVVLNRTSSAIPKPLLRRISNW